MQSSGIILSRLDRVSIELDVRRAFTSVRAVDHPGGEPPLLPDSGASGLRKGQGMAGYVAQAMNSPLGCILLYAPVLDRHLEARPELADRVFCIYDMQGRPTAKAENLEEMAGSEIDGNLAAIPC